MSVKAEVIRKAVAMLCEIVEQSNGATGRIVFRDKEQRVTGFIMYCETKPDDAERLLNAIEEVESEWHEGADPDAITGASIQITTGGG